MSGGLIHPPPNFFAFAEFLDGDLTARQIAG